MAFSVLFWETLKSGTTIPVCQASSCKYVASTKKKDDFSHQYVNIMLSQNTVQNQNARMCRKLFKNGYTCEVWNRSCDNAESDLITFLYYQLVMTCPKELTTESFFFKRNEVAYQISESCYASDDYGVALLKYVGRKLRCCYVDIETCLHKFGTIPFAPTRCSVQVCKKTVWVLEKALNQVCEFHWMNFDTNEVRPIVKKIHFEVFSIPGEYITQRITFNTNSLMFDKHISYVQYVPSSKHGLTTKTIPEELYRKSKANMIVGDLCLMQVNDGVTYPPKIYIASLMPDIRVKFIIDFTQIFVNPEQYFPYGFELTVYPNGMKALIQTGESYIIILDLSKFCISQILTYIDCFWQHKLRIMYSQDGQKLKFIGSYQGIESIHGHLKKCGKVSYLVAEFGMWYGITLKDICKHIIKTTFVLKDLEKEDIPRFLLRELEI